MNGSVLVLVWVVLVVIAAPGVIVAVVGSSAGTDGRVRAVDGGIRIDFRPHVPAAVAVLSFLMAGMLATAAVLDFAVPRLLSAVLAGAFLLLLVAAVGTLRRKPRVLLTLDGLDYRGWGADARISWDDVAGTEADFSNGLRPIIDVLAKDVAPSFRYDTALVALPEPMGPRPAVRVLARGLDEPYRLEVFVNQMRAAAPEERAFRLGEVGLRWLDGTLLS
ncbi:hypothetical protein NSZ01_20090 [Nocardioides szechwanensis]|uniref:Uncharacterized protein n=1 Tax=Nocardioides szechwanensis TaxID=1005944 RepID=A0A1H0HAQ1_9ACTN|nr:hypothetical protein [Nocardioides szechwanensis]GEP34241.1 hypothetical protein NSZ01_20090 [Nocardioides szechwanensis]SDO16286.1 hypothetical protein SAMN05192576_3524 [Nocardioides szechwanensis]